MKQKKQQSNFLQVVFFFLLMGRRSEEKVEDRLNETKETRRLRVRNNKNTFINIKKNNIRPQLQKQEKKK